jgi:hypothetical protein
MGSRHAVFSAALDSIPPALVAPPLWIVSSLPRVPDDGGNGELTATSRRVHPSRPASEPCNAQNNSCPRLALYVEQMVCRLMTGTKTDFGNTT